MILVAGGTGHLGIELVPLLTARGVPVRVVTRDPDRARQRLGESAQFAKGDARSPQTLEAALRAIQTRGLRTKAWASRAGRRHIARPFSRMTLRRLLSNVLYTGAVNHKGTLYPGEQERLVDQELWERVNAQLSLRSVHQRGRTHGRQEAPLSGVLYCAACGSAKIR